MTYLRPTFRHPELPENILGYTRKDYEGAISTLCAGCGHDSISGAIVQACWEMAIEPHKVAKLSGIGCSSKTPTYFLSNSHGFNTVHGRMPSVATGANLANRDLTYLGVSGDGDSASIGMGQFVHAIRRNLNVVYILMNNGCYGLTKGQDSATADVGSKSKSGSENKFATIDLASLAIELGATFVARSFSGDKKQLVPLIKAALAHGGFAFLDVVSPCVTFNNNFGSTKSYSYVREHNHAASNIDFVPPEETISVDYPENTARELELHGGNKIVLHKLPTEWDPLDRISALNRLHQARRTGEIVTGLLFIEPDSQDLHATLDTVHEPLNQLQEKDLCPGSKTLEQINRSYR
ncbi:MAG: 2-oxoacid:ferredoxin oxidoreductase subunit beta [Lewinellaceae bacterium]|nr:2-oxoacid:ferredoxin oxidoreductase subunit beta [Saprospiraceae bacterium]MCB9312309.1 2-oxoacid:ferredoxin oxidoreductase subunit beta [Lewinellaceae bacterium]HRW75178.1 2-oxoacid:ferredoxin oxidoreductase subunit beta [Saprospiraceae bacterium]